MKSHLHFFFVHYITVRINGQMVTLMVAIVQNPTHFVKMVNSCVLLVRNFLDPCQETPSAGDWHETTKQKQNNDNKTKKLTWILLSTFIIKIMPVTFQLNRIKWLLILWILLRRRRCTQVVGHMQHKLFIFFLLQGEFFVLIFFYLSLGKGFSIKTERKALEQHQLFVYCVFFLFCIVFVCVYVWLWILRHFRWVQIFICKQNEGLIFGW